MRRDASGDAGARTLLLVTYGGVLSDFEETPTFSK